MTPYEIPLTPEPQSFSIALGGVEYRLTVRWAEATEGGWLLDIQTTDNATPLITGIPLVTGADLLEQYGYLGFGGGLWLDSELPPSWDNLGVDVRLYFMVQ
jgi:hypothetical protein